MKKDPTIYLNHILESINLLEKYLKGVTGQQFHNSEEKQDLATRRIEIIGEAAKNLPDEFKKQNPAIPWKRMAGMRDILIHQYDDIDYIIVWETATLFIPPLKKQIIEILQKEYGERNKK